MLLKEIKYGEGVEIDLSSTTVKQVRIIVKRSRYGNAVKLCFEADKSIPISGIKDCQDGQRKGEGT